MMKSGSERKLSSRPVIRMLLLCVIGASLAFPAWAQDPTVSISDAIITEGNGGSNVITFTVSLSAPFDRQVIVSFATGDDPSGSFRATAGSGSCSAGEDYIGLASAVTLAGNANAPPSAQIVLTACPDAIDEFDETFVINITGVTNSGSTLAIADGQGRGTIVDDDALPSVRINDVQVTEGDNATAPGVATLTVSLSSVSGKDVTIPSVSTQNASAIGGTACNGSAGVDFVTTTAAPLTIPRGAPSVTFSVPVCGDVLDEANETFSVRFTAAENATVGDGTGVVTIVDNDPFPLLRVADASAAEDRFVTQIIFGTPRLVLVNGTLPFVVSLSAPSGRPVSFTYTTVNGTALGTDACSQGGDYERRVSVTETIPANTTTRTISIVTCANLFLEPNETLMLNVGSVTNATLADGTGLGTIRNNDTQTGSFSVDPEEARAVVHEPLSLALSWVVPEPQVWRTLETIDIRIRDDADMLLWVRWDEATNTFRAFNDRSGKFGPPFLAGSNARLESPEAHLLLADSRVVPGGPTAPDVTLQLSLMFKPRAGGRTYVVEVAATDDFGHEQDFEPAGTLTVLESGNGLSSKIAVLDPPGDGLVIALPNQLETRAFPNPVKEGTASIHYTIPADLSGSPVEISLFDVTGRRVRTLLSEPRSAGQYSVDWDLRDESGSPISNGIFFYRITAGNQQTTQKLLILSR